LLTKIFLCGTIKFMDNRETMRKAGYKYVTSMSNNKEHILFNLNTGEFELWFANKHTASYAIKYKNTELEFAQSLGTLEYDKSA